MADRRLIARSIVNSGQVSRMVRRCGPWAGLFFSWSLPFIDDDSRMDGDPETVRSLIFPRYLDLVTTADVAEFIAMANDIDLVTWYEVRESPGELYLYFPRFVVHQSIRADRYAPSRRPAPPSWVPDDGHPYTKNSRLMLEKPQADKRRTNRIPKRKAIELWDSSTSDAVSNGDNQLATDRQPLVAISHPIESRPIESHPIAVVAAAPTQDAIRSREGTGTRATGMRRLGEVLRDALAAS